MESILKVTSFILLALVLVNNSCKKETSCENCVDSNKPPIANAGPDQAITLPTDSISLDGSNSSDPDGNISVYHWTKIAGPASFIISNIPAARTVVKNLAAGSYLFELIVTDNGGLTAKDTVRIIVNDPAQANRPPVANAGTNQTIILPVNSINLDGSSSTDLDNNITSYVWSKISGPASFNTINANAVQTQVNNLLQGTYQFELKVTDAGGLFSKDTVQLTVNASSTNQPADANAGPDIMITLPLDSVYLTGSISVVPANFHWTLISGPSNPVIVVSAPSQILVKNLIPGFYSFRLKVSNGAGISADTMNVSVIDDPLDLNTITFLNLKWRFADEYGTGYQNLDILTPNQPNLFMSWDQLRPVEIYLQTDSSSQWFIVPSVQSGISYVYDAASPVIWIARIPEDSSWVGKTSSIKIKLL